MITQFGGISTDYEILIGRLIELRQMTEHAKLTDGETRIIRDSIEHLLIEVNKHLENESERECYKTGCSLCGS